MLFCKAYKLSRSFNLYSPLQIITPVPLFLVVSLSRTSKADAISDLPSLVNGASIDRMPYKQKATSQYAKMLRGRSRYSYNNLVSYNSELILERYKHIPQGGNWENIPEELMRNYPSIMNDWDERYGDRMAKIVFIGQHLDKEQISKDLDECLVEIF